MKKERLLWFCDMSQWIIKTTQFTSQQPYPWSACTHAESNQHRTCLQIRLYEHKNPITKTHPIQIYYKKNFTSKYWKFSDKKLWYFSYFYSKNRLWVLVRTASATIYGFSKNKKYNVYPCKPQFYYIKVGFKGVKFIKACFRDAYKAVCPVWDGKGLFSLSVWEYVLDIWATISSKNDKNTINYLLIFGHINCF